MPRLASITCAVLLTIAPFSASIAHAESSTDSTVPTEQVQNTSPYSNLQNDPDECFNSNPKPNCGVKPQASGDRGGWMQFTVFGVMLGALAVIGTVLVRNVIKRDRAIAEQLTESKQ
jgi:hypothetical protein